MNIGNSLELELLQGHDGEAQKELEGAL